MFHNRKMERSWIKDRVDSLGKTYKGLADAIGVPPPRVNDIFTKGRVIRAEDIAPMANFLDMKPVEVLARLFPNEKAYTRPQSSIDIEQIKTLIHDSVLEAVQIAHDHDLEFVPEEFAKLAADRARIYLEIKHANPDMDARGVDAATHATLDNIIRNVRFGS